MTTQSLLCVVLTGCTGTGKTEVSQFLEEYYGFSSIPILTTKARSCGANRYEIISHTDYEYASSSRDLLWTTYVTGKIFRRDYSVSRTLVMKTLQKSGRGVIAVTPDKLMDLKRFFQRENVEMVHIHLIASDDFCAYQMLIRGIPQTKLLVRQNGEFPFNEEVARLRRYLYTHTIRGRDYSMDYIIQDVNEIMDRRNLQPVVTVASPK